MGFMEVIYQIFIGLTMDKAVELLANMSLYAYPVLIFLNAKIKTRKINAKKEDDSGNDILRYVYVKKTLFWMLMGVLYALSIGVNSYTSLAVLSSPTMVVYFGLSWGLISIEIKSIYRSYKEVKSSIYVPTLRRPSFWVLMAASVFKVWQLMTSGDFGAPSQLMAILDLSSYIFMASALFIFVFFDKKKDVVEKALIKSRKIVISIKNNVVRDDKYRAKRNREIKKLLRLLKVHLDLIGDDNEIKKRAVEQQIKELEILLLTSSN